MKTPKCKRSYLITTGMRSREDGTMNVVRSLKQREPAETMSALSHESS